MSEADIEYTSTCTGVKVRAYIPIHYCEMVSNNIINGSWTYKDVSDYFFGDGAWDRNEDTSLAIVKEIDYIMENCLRYKREKYE